MEERKIRMLVIRSEEVTRKVTKNNIINAISGFKKREDVTREDRPTHCKTRETRGSKSQAN